MHRPLLLLPWLIRLACALNLKLPRTEKRDHLEYNAVLACASYINTLKWSFDSSLVPGFYSTVCLYSPAFDTWSLCIYNSVTDHALSADNTSFEGTLANVRNTCSFVDRRLSNISLEQYYSSLDNASSHAIRHYDSVERLSTSVRVDFKTRSKWIRAFHAHAFNLDISSVYGTYLSYYFVVIGVIAVFFHMSHYNGLNRALFGCRVINYIRGRFVLPTFLIKKHADYFKFLNVELFTGLMPSSIESWIILGYSLANIIFLSIGYIIDPYNLIFKNHLSQFTRLLGDRSGILAFTQFPLIIIFTARNSFLEFLTGLKFNSYISFHKWIGRIMVLNAVVHSLSYSLFALANHSFTVSNKQLYWKYGIASITTLCVLLVLSLGIVRKTHYEFFLYTHIILAILFFYCCWKHVKIFNGWKEWIVVSLAIWALEKVFRIWNVLRFRFPKATLINLNTSKNTHNEMFKVIIPKHNKNWHSKPGQYCFIYFLHPLLFWQCHPFTIIDEGDKCVLVIKPKNGLTRFIYNRVLQSLNGKLQLRVAIEGPYGPSNHKLAKFDHLLLLSGGTGLPGPLDHALKLSQDPAQATSINLIIAIKNLSFLNGYKAEILQLKKARSHVNVQIYLTQKAATAKASSTARDQLINFDDIITQLTAFAQVRYTRPNINELIEDTIKNSTPTDSVAIVCCGPPVLVDDVRNNVSRKVLDYPSRVIEYFEEYQCW
ncbi:fre6p [Saccharomyces arboricola H-6]|uniref:Fre6p n=1 Tax=Saccharomyces arboricola (strain H-6 / AS 2.3317 / CBS 10644) TaxID=1160507 RepID=J8PL13_SACAR|nr:fre6p [Saccharomyces arboricola H-6]